jgi:hypothetical protein
VKILLRDLRASSLLWTTPAIIAAQLLGATALATPGVVLWSDVDSGLGASGVIAAPLAAGAAAFEAQRRYGRGMAARAAAATRGPEPAVVLHAVASLAWILAGTSIAAAGYALVYAVVGAHGHADPLWAVSGVLGIVAAGSLGYAIGAVLRLWLVAPLVAVAVYLGATLAGGLQFSELYWVSQLYPSTIRESSPFDVTITATFVGQAIWYLGLIASAIAVVIALVRGRLSGIVAAVAVVALVAGGSIVRETRGQAVHSDPAAAGPTACSEASGLRICVLAAYEASLPELLDVFAPLYALTRGTALEFPGTLQHLPRGIGDEPPPGSASLHLDALGPNSIGQDSVRGAALEFTQTEIVCRDRRDYADAPDGGLWMVPVTAVLANDGRLDASLVIGELDRLEDAVAVLRDMSTEELRTWLDDHAARILACELDAGDYPIDP